MKNKFTPRFKQTRNAQVPKRKVDSSKPWKTQQKNEDLNSQRNSVRTLILLSLVFFASCKSKQAVVDSEDVKAPASKEVTKTELQDKRSAAVQIAEDEEYDPIKMMKEQGIGPRDYADSIVVGIERTSCFGTCPAYEILVSKNGYVSYNGVAFIEPLGKHYAQISKEDVTALVILSERFGYSGLEEAYWEPITDVPSTYTTVLFENKRTRVLNQSEAPQNLIDFESELDKILLNLDWIKVKE